MDFKQATFFHIFELLLKNVQAEGGPSGRRRAERESKSYRGTWAEVGVGPTAVAKCQEKGFFVFTSSMPIMLKKPPLGGFCNFAE